MKKTLNINIGNSIIHIEEDAYELLKAYLNEIKAHFARNADDLEIVRDIENRIAEMFREVLHVQQKQAISMDDVVAVKLQMGSVNDFETSEDEEVPFSAATTSTVKKLYRDTDKSMIAGVCAGLGHYLNIEERWVRLFFLIFIFMGGASIWVYLIMWIIVPRANTRSERMYMKGQAVNLEGFIRNFEEEMQSNQLMKKSGGLIKQLFELFGRFLAGTGRVIFKIGAGFIIFIAGCFLLSLVVTLAGFVGLFDANTADLFPFNMINAAYFTPFLLALFASFAIPLFALILLAIRVAFNGAPVNKSFSFGLLIIWLGGLGFSTYFAAKVSAEFKEEAEFSQVNTIKPFASYTLELNKSRFFSKADSIKYQLNAEEYRGSVVVDDNDGPFTTPQNVRIDIEKSQNGKFFITQNFSSQGKTFDNALKHARNIRYDFSQKDSVLLFSPKLYLNQNVKWRNQEVHVMVSVPVGTKLILSDELDRYLQNYRSWSCEIGDGVDRDYNEWVMTEEGLKCIHELKNGEHQ